MNKELFVSSTPHETKVGLVEDDLLAEVYLERENEYTLAGSIYKGRVTRVLPGMQSAFVDIGLERDAFLYVSDFMDLEEHDDELTDVIPANRGVQDMRPQSAAPHADQAETAGEDGETGTQEIAPGEAEEETRTRDEYRSAAEPPASEAQPASTEAGQENGGDRDRTWRGRRRRRGGRRDGRDRGGDRERGSGERVSESRPSRSNEARTPSGPPAGYQPILLPGESISKYQRYSQQAPAQ